MIIPNYIDLERFMPVDFNIFYVIYSICQIRIPFENLYLYSQHF